MYRCQTLGLVLVYTMFPAGSLNVLRNESGWLHKILFFSFIYSIKSKLIKLFFYQGSRHRSRHRILCSLKGNKTMRVVPNYGKWKSVWSEQRVTKTMKQKTKQKAHLNWCELALVSAGGSWNSLERRRWDAAIILKDGCHVGPKWKQQKKQSQFVSISINFVKKANGRRQERSAPSAGRSRRPEANSSTSQPENGCGTVDRSLARRHSRCPPAAGSLCPSREDGNLLTDWRGSQNGTIWEEPNWDDRFTGRCHFKMFTLLAHKHHTARLFFSSLFAARLSLFASSSVFGRRADGS